MYLKSFVDGVEHKHIEVDGDWVIVPWWFWSTDPEHEKLKREMYKSADEVVRGILEAIAPLKIMANPHASYLFKIQRQGDKLVVDMENMEERADIWTPTIVYCLNGKVGYLEHAGMNNYIIDVYSYQTNFLRFSYKDFEHILWVTDSLEKLEKDAKKFRDSDRSPRYQVVVRSSSTAGRLEVAEKDPEDAAKNSYPHFKHFTARLGGDARDPMFERMIEKAATYGLEREAKVLIKMGEVEEGVPSVTSIGTAYEWYKFLARLYKVEKDGTNKSPRAPWYKFFAKFYKAEKGSIDADKFLRTPEAAKKLKDLVLSAIREIKVYDGFRVWTLPELLGEWRVEEFAENVVKRLSEDKGFATLVKAGVAHIDRGFKRYIYWADQQALFNSYSWAIDVNSYVTARILEEADKVGVIVVYKNRVANFRKDLVERAQRFLEVAEREKKEKERELVKA